MSNLNTRLAIITLVMLLFFRIVFGTTYYVETNSLSAGAYITINDIPLECDVRDNLSYSSYINPFLVNGKNVLDVTYVPGATSDENANAKWSLYKIPDDVGYIDFTTDKYKLANGKFESKITNITQLYSNNEFALKRGLINKKGKIVLEGKTHEWQFGGLLLNNKSFDRLPSKINYSQLSSELDNVRICFMKHDTPIKICYQGITFPSGSHEISLDRKMMISGGQWVNENGFDEIMIIGTTTTNQTVEEIQMGTLCVEEFTGNCHASYEFDVQGLPYFNWKYADKYAILTGPMKMEIANEITKIADALDNKNIKGIDSVLKYKIDNLQIAKKGKYSDYEKSQNDYIQQFFNCAGWKIQPIEASDIEYILLDQQRVIVKTFDRKNVIRSVMIKYQGQNAGYFELPLCFAHLNGKWVDVWK